MHAASVEKKFKFDNNINLSLGWYSKKQIVIFKKITTFFSLKEMFWCYELHRQLENIWKTIRNILQRNETCIINYD